MSRGTLSEKGGNDGHQDGCDHDLSDEGQPETVLPTTSSGQSKSASCTQNADEYGEQTADRLHAGHQDARNESYDHAGKEPAQDSGQFHCSSQPLAVRDIQTLAAWEDQLMRRIGPVEGQLTDVEFSSALYPWPVSALNKEKVWVRCNMVMTQDGAAAGADGRSASIASAIDKKVFGALRRDCDVILVGAGTARAEGYRPAAVPIALVSQHLNLRSDLPLFSQSEPDSPTTFLMTTANAIKEAPEWMREGAELIACGEEDVDLAVALHELKRRGLTRVHSEGGPSLLTSLIQAALLDELLLTITPMIQGSSTSLIGNLDMPVSGAFTQVLVEDGTLLLRFEPDYSKA